MYKNCKIVVTLSLVDTTARFAVKMYLKQCVALNTVAALLMFLAGVAIACLNF